MIYFYNILITLLSADLGKPTFILLKILKKIKLNNIFKCIILFIIFVLYFIMYYFLFKGEFNFYNYLIIIFTFIYIYLYK